MSGKKASVWFNYNKLQVISTMYKLLGYDIWWNCLTIKDVLLYE